MDKPENLTEAASSRFQLSINVNDVTESIEFYTKLFGVEPNKVKEGYANFVVDDPPMKLVVIENEGTPGTLNHLGIEYPDGQGVATQTEIAAAAGLPIRVEDEHTCCFASQEKAWTQDADGVPWEFYTVIADTEDFGANPDHGDSGGELAASTSDDRCCAPAATVGPACCP